jgi:hypothetical protein
MARKTEKLTLGTETFHVTQVGARVSLRTLLVIAKSVVPAIKLGAGAVRSLRKLAGTGKGLMTKLLQMDTEQEVDSTILSALASAAGKLFELLTPDDFEKILDALLLSGSVQLQKGKGAKAELEDLDGDLFDDLFAGRWLDALQLLAFALKVNYVSFSAARSALEKLGITVDAGEPEKAESGSGTSSTSSGPSSES